jgi:predicted nucleic acid binding AN1-type Zn finger protein
VTDQSDSSGNKRDVEYSINWRVSDTDDNLDSVTLRLIDGNGDTAATANPTVSGGSGSAETTLSDDCNINNNRGCGYQIEIEVTDTDSASDSESESDTADGTNPQSLAPIQWDLETTA